MNRNSGPLLKPTAVCQLHLERHEQTVADLAGCDQALVVFRLRGSVIGQAWLPVLDGRVPPTELGSSLISAAWPAWQQLMAAGPDPDGPLPTATVIVCTRDRTDDLARCLPGLSALAAQGHEVIVVDNCPSDEGSARLVATYPAIRYLREPRPGLDVARNRGLQAATGEVVAFTDDDAVVDPGWLLALQRNFDDPLVAVVTGITLPLELETPAQIWFERTNAFQRGFERRSFDATDMNILATGQVGAGVNMAVRRHTISEIGLFDEALDAGTPSRSGGDQEFFFRVLARGYRIVYEPAALVWHRHRREWDALRHTIYGYGVGVFAWWTSALLEHRELTLLKKAPSWFLRHHLRNLLRTPLGQANRIPLDLAFAELFGALAGPVCYLRSRRWLREQLRTAEVGQKPTPVFDHTPRCHGPNSCTNGQEFGDPTTQPPDLSIVVPTHNRSTLLRRGLAALGYQSWPASQFEVVVVADTCQDDTVQMVADYSAKVPYQLRVLSHSAGSAGATRNLGAASARGRVLLFLDDDVVARPGLVQAHMEAQGPNQVVLGYSKPVLPAEPDWWAYDARRWWEDTFSAMRRPGYRFTYRDFFSGNVSMPSALFRRVGGFDNSFSGSGYEDFELGIRLLKAGARFCFVPEAAGDHYDDSDLAKWLRRVRLEGKGSVLIGERHPELLYQLFAYWEQPHRAWRPTLRMLAFAHAQWGDWLDRLLMRQAVIYEHLRLRHAWSSAVAGLREYNFWRGVAAAIGGRQALTAWLQQAPKRPFTASDAPLIDLATLPSSDGLRAALEQGTSKGLRLHWGEAEVMALPTTPGAEPLREEHLHRALQELAQQHFVPALAMHIIRSANGGELPW